MKNLKLTSISQAQKTAVKIGDVTMGEGFCVIAGPCSVESQTQMMETAEAVKKAGADMLRGGAFKPRSSPYSFTEAPGLPTFWGPDTSRASP